MRVIYELNQEDIRRIVCEKYGVSSDKVEFKQIAAIDCRIDMSTTETPGKDPEPEREIVKAPIPIPKHEQEESSGYKFRSDVVEYEQITDTDILDMLSNDVSVADVCHHYGFDQKIRYRLYKRFEKARLECASKCDG